MFQAPLTKAAGLFQAFTRNFAYGVQALIDQRVAAGEVLPEATEPEAPAAEATEVEAPAAERRRGARHRGARPRRPRPRRDRGPSRGA